jgi:hypothetical protein
MFQRRFIDQPNEWQTIEEAILKKELRGYYANLEEIIFMLFNGGQARTTYAYYRYTRTS